MKKNKHCVYLVYYISMIYPFLFPSFAKTFYPKCNMYSGTIFYFFYLAFLFYFCYWDLPGAAYTVFSCCIAVSPRFIYFAVSLFCRFFFILIYYIKCTVCWSCLEFPSYLNLHELCFHSLITRPFFVFLWKFKLWV